MKIKFKTVLAVGLCLAAVCSYAAEYHVSPSGSDTPSGGTIESPWKTVTYGISRLAAGDTLNIHSGTYRESQIYPPEGGPTGTADDKRVAIKGWQGEEGSPPPVLTAMRDASGTGHWIPEGKGVFRYTGKSDRTWRHVSIDGKPLRMMTRESGKEPIYSGSAAEITGPGQWATNKKENALWVRVPGDVNPGTTKIEVSDAFSTVTLPRDKAFITFEGVVFEGGYYPLNIEADDVIIRNCTSRNCFGDAIKVSGWTDTPQHKDVPEWNSERGVIENCDLYHFGESGIDVTGGDYWTIRDTTIHDGVKNRSAVLVPSSCGGKLNGIMLKNNNVGTRVDGCRIFSLDTVFGAIGIGGITDGRLRVAAENLVVVNTVIQDVSGPYIVSFLGARNCQFTNNVLLRCNTTNSIPHAPEALIQIRAGDADGKSPSVGAILENNIFYGNTSTYNYSERMPASEEAIAKINRNVYGPGETRKNFLGGADRPFGPAYKGYDADSFTIPPPAGGE